MSPKSCSGSSLTLNPVKGVRQAPPEVFLLRVEPECWGEDEEKLGRKGGCWPSPHLTGLTIPSSILPYPRLFQDRQGGSRGAKGLARPKAASSWGRLAPRHQLCSKSLRSHGGRGLEKGSRVNWQWGGQA